MSEGTRIGYVRLIANMEVQTFVHQPDRRGSLGIDPQGSLRLPALADGRSPGSSRLPEFPA